MVPNYGVPKYKLLMIGLQRPVKLKIRNKREERRKKREFDIVVEHWQWPHRPGRSMIRPLAVSMKSSWFAMEGEHSRWPYLPVSLMD